MYKCVKAIDNPLCLEIGRYHGGSAMILLSAGAKVITIDNYCKDEVGYSKYDDELVMWATANGLRDNLDVIVGDSHTYHAGDMIDVLFLDGQHSYEGVVEELDDFFGCLKPGGSMFLHDIHIEGVHKAFDEKRALFSETEVVSTLLHAKKLENDV